MQSCGGRICHHFIHSAQPHSLKGVINIHLVKQNNAESHGFIFVFVTGSDQQIMSKMAGIEAANKILLKIGIRSFSWLKMSDTCDCCIGTDPVHIWLIAILKNWFKCDTPVDDV